MKVEPPARHELDPIEIASRDEIAALQLERMQRTLDRAYQNVPHYRRAFEAAGVHPDDLRELSAPGALPLHGQGRPAPELSLRHVRRAARTSRADPCIERHHGPGHGGRLHAR